MCTQGCILEGSLLILAYIGRILETQETQDSVSENESRFTRGTLHDRKIYANDQALNNFPRCEPLVGCGNVEGCRIGEIVFARVGFIPFGLRHSRRGRYRQNARCYTTRRP